MKRKALFLDRDGTINEDVGYLYQEEKLKILPSVPEALQFFQSKGYLLIVISNQSGVGKGLYRAEDVEKINQKIQEELSHKGVRIDAFYFCPHHPDQGCPCRKPSPGLFLKAIHEWNIDPSLSINVGDTLRDLEAGIRSGIKKNFLVLTGKGKETLKNLEEFPLREKVEIIRDLGELVRIFKQNFF